MHRTNSVSKASKECDIWFNLNQRGQGQYGLPCATWAANMPTRLPYGNLLMTVVYIITTVKPLTELSSNG